MEDNKLTVTIKVLFWEFYLYGKFTCRNENNDKYKTLDGLSKKSFCFLILLILTQSKPKWSKVFL